MIKVQTNRELLANESMVKIQDRTVRFTFDKYNSGKSLSLELTNLTDQLDWKGLAKKIKGEFGVFIIKKKKPKKWKELFRQQDLQDNSAEMENKIYNNKNKDIKTSLLSQDHQNNQNISKKNKGFGMLTNELVEAMYSDKRLKRMERKQSRAKSLVKNIKNILGRYGDKSRKSVLKSESLMTTGAKIGDRTKLELESFMKAEQEIGHQNGRNVGPLSKFASNSSDKAMKGRRNSPSIKLSNTEKILLGNKTDGFQFRREEENSASPEKIDKRSNNQFKNSGKDFKVLTIEDIMQREDRKSRRNSGSPGNRRNHWKASPKDSSPKWVKSNPFLSKSKDMLVRKTSHKSENLKDKVNDLAENLKKHKSKIKSQTDVFKRRSILHKEMSLHKLQQLKQSRKSIRRIDYLTQAYGRNSRLSRNHSAKKSNFKTEANNNHKFEIEVSTDFMGPMASNSSKPSNRNNLPIRNKHTVKSQKINRLHKKARNTKSGIFAPTFNKAHQKLRSIEKSIQKSKSKGPDRSKSRPYQNKNSSIVFTKRRPNKQVKRNIRGKSKSKSKVKHISKKNIRKVTPTIRRKISTRRNYKLEVEAISDGVTEKKEEIMDTFASLSLDMTWVHNQCRNIDLDTSDGILRFFELQNRLIVKLSTKLRKEKNSRYKVEKQCQVMMEKFTRKLN